MSLKAVGGGGGGGSQPRIAACMPIFNHPTAQTFYATKPLTGVTDFFSIRGLPLDRARNSLTAQALASPATHFLWIDSDMADIPPDAAERLLAHDLDIVGGLYWSRQPPYLPVLLREVDRQVVIEENPPPCGVFPCAGVGAGFLLVRRQVFEAVATRFGFGSWWSFLPDRGDDVSFMLRAARCGFTCHVDADLRLGHVGEVVVTEAVAAALRAT